MKRLAHGAMAALALACAAAPAYSAVVLQVDVSNSAAVTFTATSNHSQVDDSLSTTTEGVDLLLFLRAALSTAATNSIEGNLAPPNDLAETYDMYYVDDYSAAYVDLNLYGSTPIIPFAIGPVNPQYFSTSAPAFTGRATADLSAFENILPAAGATGDIITGYRGFGSNLVIGQWQVVPEPAAMATMMFGAAFLLRRRQRQ